MNSKNQSSHEILKYDYVECARSILPKKVSFALTCISNLFSSKVGPCLAIVVLHSV